DSIPGKGTTIVLEIPLIADRNPENRYGYGKPLAGRRLLLADANALSRDSLRERFRHWGAEVVAVDPHAAKAAGDFDLAIVAVERMQLGDTAALRARCKSLPEGVPRMVVAATIDHEVLRSIGQACDVPCVPKAGHKEAQLRRILGLLGMAFHELETDAGTANLQRLRSLRVVVADDNRINRYFLRKILELHGADVI